MRLSVASVVLWVSTTLLLFSVPGPIRLLTTAAPLYTPPRNEERLETPKTYEEKRKPSEEELTGYLQRFGYMGKQGRSKSSHGDKDTKSAIRRLQRFGGLKETGSWNNDTIRLFHRPRCGLPDNPPVNATRTKRYAVSGSRWSKSDLYYRFQSFSGKVKPTPLMSAFDNSFKKWSVVVPLSFAQTYSSSSADISIAFARLDHGDGYPFDGPGGTLSHTYPPKDGRLHMDEDEKWTIASSDGIDLRQVALHEIGHLIGLAHSSVISSIMYPYYPGFQQDYRLSQDDIDGAQSIYGVPNNYAPLNEDENPASSSTTTTTSITTTPTTPTTATTTTATTTTTSSSSSPQPRMTPAGNVRLTPAANPARITPLRTTPRR